MSITTDLTTNIGKVRLEIGDNDSGNGRGVKPDGTNLTDEQVQYFLDVEGTVGRATAHACEALARAWTKMANSTRSNRRDEWADVAKGWREMAAGLRLQFGGGIPLGAMSAPFVRVDGYSAHAGELEEL